MVQYLQLMAADTVSASRFEIHRLPLLASVAQRLQCSANQSEPCLNTGTTSEEVSVVTEVEV